MKTKVYHQYFDKKYEFISPTKNLQKSSVNKSIKYVKMGKVKEAEKILRPAVNQLIKKKCKKIILGLSLIHISDPRDVP